MADYSEDLESLLIEADQADVEPDTDAGELRARTASLDLSMFQRLQSERGAGRGRQSLLVTFFPNANFEIKLGDSDGEEGGTVTRREEDGVITWVGRARSAQDGQRLPDGTFILTVADGIPSLSIMSLKGNFHMQPLSNGNFRFFEEDPAHPVECATADVDFGLSQRPGFGFDFDEDEPTTEVQIRVLMLYTAAATQAIGAANIRSHAEHAANIATTAFGRSGIGMARVVPIPEQTTFRESPNFGADLERITSDSQIATRRQATQADVVTLMRGPARGVWGIAWMLQRLNPSTASRAFNVVYFKQASPFMVFAHELGHNLGCAHNRESVDATGLYPDAKGHHFTAPGQGHVGTIMSYFGRRILHYSNPSIRFPVGEPNAVPTGTGNSNNARAINASKQLVSRYR